MLIKKAILFHIKKESLSKFLFLIILHKELRDYYLRALTITSVASAMS